MEASAINQPHVDAPPDEAEAFFGGDPAISAPEEDPPFDEPARALDDADPTGGDSEAGLPDDAAAQASVGGEQSREYIIFRKVKLSVHHLTAMIKAIEAGEVAQVTAFLELHRPVARNDRAAVSAAYAVHQETLGDTCDLAVVSARSFKERHVEPEIVPPERRVKIT